jgi:hypothetical protein
MFFRSVSDLLDLRNIDVQPELHDAGRNHKDDQQHQNDINEGYDVHFGKDSDLAPPPAASTPAAVRSHSGKRHL